MVAEAKIKPKEKAEMLQNLKKIGILTAQTEFILGVKKKFSHLEFPLLEALEITEAILSDRIKKSKVKLILPKTDLIVKADRDVVMGGLEHIILRLLPLTDKIEIKIDTKKKWLSMHYKADRIIKLNGLPLVDTLKKSSDPLEIFFEIHVQLMKASGVKAHFKEGVVEILF